MQNAASLVNLHKEDIENDDQFWDGGIDEDEFWEEVYTGSHKRRRKKQKILRVKGERKSKSSSGKINIAFVSDANGKYVTALRRVHDRQKKVIEYVRVPSLKVSDRRWGASDPKIPFSWAKQIAEYVDPNIIPVSSYVSSHENVLKAMNTPSIINPLVGIENSSSGKAMLNQKHKYLAVMMSPPWKASEHKRSIFASPPRKKKNNLSSSSSLLNNSEEEKVSNRVLPSDLVNLPFNNPEWESLVFAFVWVRKDLISQVVDAMSELSFYYVENLCWVKQEVNNTFSNQPSPYIRTTHETLLIFRRGTPATGLVASRNDIITWEPVEMRHQRTEDVVFDFVRPLPSRGANNDDLEHKPDDFCYNMVERMLPHSVHEDPEEGVEVDGTGSRFEKARLGDHNVKRPIRERGQLLHLWSENIRRTGWTMVHQTDNTL
jgi:hypothetical protein